jgi:hypothetical protein
VTNVANMPKSVTVRGSSAGGAACAFALAQASVPVRVVGSSKAATGLRMISSPVLHDLHLSNSATSQGAVRIVNRRLLEDDATDSIDSSGDLVIARHAEIVAALLQHVTVAPPSSPNVERRGDFLVDANELSLGNPRLYDDETISRSDTRICLYLEWTGTVGDDARLIRLTGESLSDVQGRAWIMAGLDETVLTLALPIDALVDTSIALPDVVSRLLSHPAVFNELPDGEPSTAYTRLLSKRKRSPITLLGGTELEIGPAAGLADPICLDAELRSGLIAGKHIAAAITENRLTIARLSQITRDLNGVETGPDLT